MEPSPVSSPSTPARPSVTLVVWLMAAVYLAAHAPFLPATPYDIDGVNFALALHDYDLAKHQPHPPGAPVFVGLGRLARTTVGWATDAPTDTEGRALDAASLAIWSAGLGAVAVFGFYRLFTSLVASPMSAMLATAVTAAAPLFWFSGVRPMSDLSGLAVAAIALGFVMPMLAWRVGDAATRPPGGLATALILGCFFAGLAPGVRVQMAWLTWPAVFVTLVATAPRDWRTLALASASFFTGLAAWLIPMSALSGGPREYLRLLQTQAAEDVVAGEMLWRNFSTERAAHALVDTVIAPWGAWWLGWCAATAAAVGALVLLRRHPGRFALIVLLFGPYALLHLGFHDTSHIRYALPLVPVVALLATLGLTTLGPRLGPIALSALVASSLAVGLDATLPQSQQAAPVYRALDDIRARLETEGHARPVIAMHHAVNLALRGEPLPTTSLPAPLSAEWLELAKYWRTGGDAPIWFLASRRRTDLALIDPTSRSLVRSYRLPASTSALLAGARPRSVEWIEIVRPGWIGLEGWSLTPEIRGLTVRDYQRRRVVTTRALVRRRPDATALLLGGRNLGGPCATAAVVRLRIDGHEVERFTTLAAAPFLKRWRLPAGALAGEGPYAELEVVAEDRSGQGLTVDVAFEQFDLQGIGHAIAGLSDGWFEPEYQERQGIEYRWMSDRAALEVDALGAGATLRLRGESPRRQFTRASELVVLAGDEVIERFSLDDDFDVTFGVTAEQLRRSNGRLDLQVSQAFVPDERSGNGDRRVLALKIFAVEARASGGEPSLLSTD